MAFSPGWRSNQSQETQAQFPVQAGELIKHILTPAQTRYLVRREDLERWLEARFGQRSDLNIHASLRRFACSSCSSKTPLKGGGLEYLEETALEIR